MASTVQGSDIELLVREKDTGSFKTMTCEDTVFLDVTNDVNTANTKCGKFKGISVADFKLNGTAVYNTAPGVTELSYNEVLAFQLDRTRCEFILRNAAYDAETAGNVIRMSGDCFFTSTQFDGSDGQVARFTWAMEGDGTLNDTES